MGQGSYTASDWNKLKNSKGLSSNSNANQTFANDVIQDKYNAKYIGIRESFDSEDSKESTPIIIGFDVTGSMGYLANEIATNALNETIMQILTKKPVTNPHMMCAAFTNPSEALQVTQFEADIRVVEQLLDFKLGGGNKYAFDNILWYFAAKHTKIDSFAKRGKKGILIGIGDEICGGSDNVLSGSNIESLFSDKDVADVSFEDALSIVNKQYDVIHIVVGEEMRFVDEPDRCYGPSYNGWKEALQGRVIKLKSKDINLLAEVIVASIQLLNGVSRECALEQVVEENRDIVREAIEDFEETNPVQIDETIIKQHNDTILGDKDTSSTHDNIEHEATKKRSRLYDLFHNRK